MTAPDPIAGLCPQCHGSLRGHVSGLCPACLAQVAFFDEGDGPAPSAAAPVRLGDYDVLEEIGRGGMGVVYRARQRGLERLVALKVIPAGPLADPEVVRRFRAEARAAAGLHHPHVVRVHEVGEDGEHAFFSMDLVEGRSLSQRVRESGPPAPKDAAALLAKVAAGLQHAHERDLLHRDIKPANILLDAADEPRVADFGLAKPLAGRSDAELTLTHHTVGTPGYLAPEQVLEQEDATPRTDVYGLGATLYFTLTGRPPFPARTMAEFLDAVRHLEPPAPRLLDPAIPRDLETICLKCLEKSPARRYASAAEVAADLGRFLADEPIHARPLGALGRTWRWMRRHRALGTSLAALFLVLTGSAIALSALWWKAERATAAESSQRLAAEEELRTSLISTARSENRSGLGGGTARALAAVRRAAAIRVDAAVRDEAVAALAMPDVTTPRRVTWKGATQLLCNPVFHPQLACAAVIDRQGHRLLVDPDSGLTRHQLEGPPATTADGDNFSATGRYLTAWTGPGAPLVWSSSDGQVVSLSARPGVQRVEWTADDSVMALCRATEVEFFTMPEAQPLRTLALRPGWHGIALSSSGDRLAIGYGESMEILATRDGARLHSLVHPKATEAPAWSADGTLLAVGCHDSLVHVWDTASGTEWARCNGHDQLPVQQEFVPGTDWVLSGGWDHTTRLWDARGGRQLLSITGNDYSLIPHSGGRMVSFVAWPDVIYTDVQAPTVVRTVREPLAPGATLSGVQDIAFSPDGALIFTAGDPGGVNAWDAKTHAHLGRAPGAAVAVIPLPGNGLLCTGRSGLRRKTWQRDGDGPLTFDAPVPAGPAGFSNHADATPDGATWAVSVCADGAPYAQRIEVWRDGAFSMSWKVQGFWPAVALSPDGRFVATGGTGACRLALFHAADGSEQPLRSPREELIEPSSLAVAFSPDSRVLASQGAANISVWDVATGARLHRLARPSGSLDRLVAFSPDGRLLAAAGPNRDIWLIDPASGERLVTLTPPSPAMLAEIALSPDSHHLAVALSNRTVLLWNLAALRGWLRSEKLDWEDAR